MTPQNKQPHLVLNITSVYVYSLKSIRCCSCVKHKAYALQQNPDTEENIALCAM